MAAGFEREIKITGYSFLTNMSHLLLNKKRGAQGLVTNKILENLTQRFTLKIVQYKKINAYKLFYLHSSVAERHNYNIEQQAPLKCENL
jgi:hypothetical protein